MYCLELSGLFTYEKQLYPVHGLLLHSKKTNKKQDTVLSQGTDGGYICFDMKQNLGYFAALKEDGEGFAVIDNSTTRKLKTLDADIGVRLRAVLNTQTLSKRPKRTSGQRSSRLIFSLNIYGRYSNATSVGIKLSSASAFL